MEQKRYFEGWYFKCCTQAQTVAFIPSFHRYGDTETASLQIITDSAAFQIPCQSICYREKPLLARIGNSTFSEKGIKLHLKTDTVSARGTLQFNDLSPIRSDIMGPFRFVPFLQCRHSVFSMRHRIDGTLNINGIPYHFRNGAGYIEGDRGCSFPKRYIWTHCFFAHGAVMLSVADIPMLGGSFTGIIGVVMHDGKEYRIATYLGARVKEIGKDFVTVKQGQLELTAKRMSQNAHPLLAPNHGKMSRTIHESAACKAYYRCTYRGETLCEFISHQASFEFEYP